MDKFVHVEILFQAILDSERKSVCWKRLWSQVIFEGEIGDKWNLNGMFNTPYFDQEMKTNFTVQVLFSFFSKRKLLIINGMSNCPYFDQYMKINFKLEVHIRLNCFEKKLNRFSTNIEALTFYQISICILTNLSYFPPFVVNRILFPQSCFILHICFTVIICRECSKSCFEEIYVIWTYINSINMTMKYEDYFLQKYVYEFK